MPTVSLLRLRTIAVLFLLALAAAAFAQGTFRNQRIFVVPTPGPVVIDGDLSDWDLSGDIYCYVSEPTKNTLYTHTAMMYDKDAFYVAGRIGDPSPMKSKWDPAVNPDFGWDADAFQLRLNLDPALGYPLKIGSYDRNPNESLVHMTMWYYTEGKQPVLHMKFGMDFHDAPEYPKGIVPKDKFQAAYKAWPDGKGYTFEYRIPWSTLRAKAPLKGGDLVAGAIQQQWSNPDGSNSSGGWGVDLLAHAGFSYQSTECWGKVIIAEKGHLPKELTQVGDDQPVVRKLPLHFNFNMPKAQQLSVALFNEKNDLVRHIVVAKSEQAGPVTETWDGIDDAGRVLPAGKYTWKAVTHDPFSVKYVLSVENSGQPGYPTADGKGAWGGDWGNPVAVAFAGDKAVLAWSGSEAGPGLIVLDGNEKKQWGGRYAVTAVATDGEWVYAYLPGDPGQIRAYAVADGKQINFLRGELWAEHNAGKTTNCTGMTYLSGKLYVSDAKVGTITEYDARKGTILRTLKVEDAHGLAPIDANTLAVISNGAVAKVNLVDGTKTLWITNHLDKPLSIAVGADGTTYVGNAGVTMNVAVFNKDGRYQRSIGKLGGRMMPVGLFDPSSTREISPTVRGKWQPTAMINPAGLALDPKGRLWVTEDDFQPKRISVWEAKSGKLLEEKFGPAYVSTPATMDPADPTHVYCNNVEWKVDLKKGTWEPSAVMIDARKDAPYFWPHMVLNIVFTAKNGMQYMHANGGPGNILYVRRGDHFQGVAGIISARANLSWRKGATTWEEVSKIGNLLWEDLNGDGIIQQNETRPTKLQPNQAHSVFDASLNMYCTGMYTDLYWERISPATIRKDGVPLYDDKTIVHYDYAKNGVCYTSDTAVNPTDGSVLMYAGADIKYMDSTETWPLTYWSKDGKLLWRFRNGCRWYDMYNFPIARPDQYWGCTKNIGITDGITGFSSYFGFIHLLTTDGVALGTLMQDGRAGGDSGADRINCEWFTGQLVKLKDGRWYLLGGDQDGRVLEVSGLNSLQRFTGEYTISAQDAKAAADALIEWSSQQARSQSLVVARTQGKPDVTGWQTIKGVKLDLDEKRKFTVQTAYDATNLYLKYTVSTNNPLTNSIQESQLLFKGGNCLDLQIATDPNADAKRTTPAPGDLRVLITRRDEKPLAVVYRPKVAGFTGDPMPFTSPTGKEYLDSIEVWNDVKLDYAKTNDGFEAVVTLPLAKLGWKPVPGTTVKMDVGYLFGNETGNTIGVRKYWNNASFSSGVTNDVPSEIRLEPAQWGAATVE